MFSSRLNRRLPVMEILERRQLLATDQWINSAGGSWGVASNWSTGAVPGPSDDAVIDVSGASPTVTISSNVESVHSRTADDPLVISGGGLTVAANSTISDGLTMSGGSLTASGSGVAFTVTGTTTVSSASLYAQSGATLSLPQLTRYSNPIDYTYAYLQSTGAGSVLSLPALTSLGQTLQFFMRIQAFQGGETLLPVLASITSNSSYVQVDADGTGSTIDLSGLTSFNSPGGSLQVTNHATVLDGQLTSLNGDAVTLDGTGTIATSQWTTLTGGSLTVTGGSYTIAGMSESLSIQNDATLSIQGAFTLNGQAGLSSTSASTLQVSGNILGNTTNSAAFNPLGSVVLDSGNGTTNPPQLVEAKSQDLGDVSQGYTNNFAYGTLELTSNTYVELVDESANSPGSAPEAVYVNTLIVPAGATLNLNGLNLYAKTEEINGTIISTSPATATFNVKDTTTQGSWIGVYGSQGYNVINATNGVAYPSYATVTPAGYASYTWAAHSNLVQALQNPSGSGRIAACWYTVSGTTSFTVDVDLTDGLSHGIELYLLDFGSTSRSENIVFSDASTHAVLSTQSVSGFSTGVYLNYTISGNVLITITKTGGANAVLSGLFFDPTPAPPAVVRGGNSTGGLIDATGVSTRPVTDPIGTLYPPSAPQSSLSTTALLSVHDAALVSGGISASSNPVTAPIGTVDTNGNDDGQPGSDTIATIAGARATAGGVPLVRTQRQPATVADVIDHLLARGELEGLRHSHRARREGHREE
jgi:hypothetical protein